MTEWTGSGWRGCVALATLSFSPPFTLEELHERMGVTEEARQLGDAIRDRLELEERQAAVVAHCRRLEEVYRVA